MSAGIGRGLLPKSPRKDLSHACTPLSFGFAQAGGGANVSPGAITIVDRTGAPLITRQPAAPALCVVVPAGLPGAGPWPVPAPPHAASSSTAKSASAARENGRRPTTV